MLDRIHIIDLTLVMQNVFWMVRSLDWRKLEISVGRDLGIPGECSSQAAPDVIASAYLFKSKRVFFEAP
jgi:hypothetical protein